MYQDARRRAALAIALVLVIAGTRPSAQSRPLVAPEAAAIDRRLLPQISRVKIFDHHAHPGFADDQEVDPAPVPAGAASLRLNSENPDWAAATTALFGVTSKARLKTLNPGPKYFDAILDSLGIGTSVANRISMSADLDPARFKWVFYIEPVLRDPRYLSTTFVLIHGGYPFEQPAILIAMMKNVWLDSSATGSFLMYPNQFKDVLKRWFEIMPGKVTFGSDALPIDEHIGAEELYWFGVHNAQTAAAVALAEMVAAREITEPQAMTIARGYLHDNAAALYR